MTPPIIRAGLFPWRSQLPLPPITSWQGELSANLPGCPWGRIILVRRNLIKVRSAQSPEAGSETRLKPAGCRKMLTQPGRRGLLQLLASSLMHKHLMLLGRSARYPHPRIILLPGFEGAYITPRVQRRTALSSGVFILWADIFLADILEYRPSCSRMPARCE